LAASVDARKICRMPVVFRVARRIRVAFAEAEA
jgi:hypothetical protein